MPNNVEEISASSSEKSEESDSESASTNSSATRIGNTPTETVSDKEWRNKIIAGEEQAVRNVRTLVMSAIIVCTIAVSASVYYFAKEGDNHSFELEYTGYVKDISSLVIWEVQYNFALMQQLAAAMTSASLLMGATFPNFTHPQYEIAGGYADGMGGIMAAVYAPLVKAEDREKWEEYSAEEQGWIKESARLKKVHPSHRDALHGTIQDHEHDRRLQVTSEPERVSDFIYRLENGRKVPAGALQDGEVYAPLWQNAPASAPAVNADLFSDQRFVDLYATMVAADQSVLSPTTKIGDLFDYMFDTEEKSRKADPHAFIMEPVYSTFDEKPQRVGFLLGLTSFGNLLDKILPEGTEGIICVVKDRCGDVMSYELNGLKSKYLGEGDLHDPAFNKYERSFQMELYDESKDLRGACIHDLYIYPSTKFRKLYDTNTPAIYTSVVVIAFTITSILLVVYDLLVTRRQEKTMRTAIKTSKFVSSLFPSNVRDRVLNDVPETSAQRKNRNNGGHIGISNAEQALDTRPIADFFPNTTVLFADISGFTAWSSVREPFQVFLLLENLYGAFDAIAMRRRVFKVETVGDSYVAIGGLPTPRADHALVMCRFARDCLYKTRDVTSKLVPILGPDTVDLSFRFGLHSGPVTGGVLRGKNARFQIFGDTVNTAARMESTGACNRIHLSDKCAALIKEAGKGHWISQRNDQVWAKGKGTMTTFWLNTTDSSLRSGTKSVSDGTSLGNSEIGSEGRQELSLRDDHLPTDNYSDDQQRAELGNVSAQDVRLVEWNTAVLLKSIKSVVDQREVEDQKTRISVEKVEIDSDIKPQVRMFVAGLVNMYRDNHFHNFEHASHVTMSVTKLLSRVSTVDDRYTKDIAADALTQFALIFSALIHDVDHSGVPNATLVSEKTPLAAMYNNKSVAERNSIEISWEFLMRPEFDEMRASICPDDKSLSRLKDLVCTIVLATDIADKDLKTDRNARWEKVFSEGPSTSSSRNLDAINKLKAGIVLEHLIQASDVCHTMQHWHIYRKWNECLFREIYEAYKKGRTDKNPADDWFQGELLFFDYYVIPLAKKLSDCGVFGVSSDEYLDYALANRNEWQMKGKEVVESLVQKYQTGPRLGRLPS